MRIKDYIVLSNKNLSTRKKSVCVSVFLISLAMFIFIISLSYSNRFLEVMDRAINKNISYRTIAVMDYGDISKEEMLKKVEDINNVEKVVLQSNYQTGVVLTNIGDELFEKSGICIQGANDKIQPNIIAGKGFDENEQGVCVVPEKFCPYKDFSPEKIIDGKSLIGKKIRVEYYSFDYRSLKSSIHKIFNKEFTVIGVYNQTENVDDYSQCYVSFEDVENIVKEVKENMLYKEKTIVVEDKGLFAIVDKAENVEKALNDIQSLNCRAIIRSVANTQLMNTIKVVCLIVSTIIIFIGLINIIISSIKSIIDRKYDIGMQKAIGYKNKNIQGILFMENLIIGVISYVVAIVISILFNLIINKYIVNSNMELHLIGLNLDIITCITAFVISVIIPTISSVLCSVLTLRNTPVALNKER